MNPQALAVWAETRLIVWPENLTLAQLPPGNLEKVLRLISRHENGFTSLVLEPHELSLTLEEDAWQAAALRRHARAEAGPFRAITFEPELEMDLFGFLAPAMACLAERQVSVIPQCGFTRDHLLVTVEQLDTAVATLESWIETAQRKSPR